MTFADSITRKGRYWIVRHPFSSPYAKRGYHVIDSTKTLDISRRVASAPTIDGAWAALQRLAA